MPADDVAVDPGATRDEAVSPDETHPESATETEVDELPVEIPHAEPPGDSLPVGDETLPPEEKTQPAPPAIPPVVDVHDLDWDAVAAAVNPGALRARMRETVERLEILLDSEDGARMLFDEHRATENDRAILVRELTDEPLWFIGDIHGDLLAVEAALALIRREAEREGVITPRIVLLGDLIDDGGYGLETVLRVFEIILERCRDLCFIAGNHDEALGFDGARFTATVSPSDFSSFLNENLAHEWIGRAGKLAVRVTERAPRALFFPDGLLAVHGGFPLTDLHSEMAETRNWNDPRCLNDFVWARAHPRARRKLPNRMTRGSQFGYEDFAEFCALSASLGRPVTHMIRGHDHVDERYEIYAAYAATPVLTTVALSRRLERELYGPHVRVPAVARWIRGSLPQVYRLHVPEHLVHSCYPEESQAVEGAEVGEQPAS